MVRGAKREEPAAMRAPYVEVPMIRARTLTFPLLTLVMMNACECDPPLTVIPEPIIVISYENQESPPRERLDIPLGASLVGQSKTVSFTVANEGGALLEVSDVRLVSMPGVCSQVSSAFRIVDPAPDSGAVRAFTLEGTRDPEADFETRAITVSFTPETGQPSCAVVEIVSNDEESPAVYALITGQGDAPQLCATNLVVDFGTHYLGETANDAFVVESCGTRPITIASMTTNSYFSDPFDVEAPTFPQTLQPGQTLTLPVSFKPLIERAWSLAGGNAGQILLLDEAQTAYQLALEGVGVKEPSCAILAVPNVINFGSVAEGQSSTTQVAVRNIGQRDCNVSSIAIREPALNFTRVVQGGNDTPVLAPGDVVTVEVTFAPPTAVGVQNGFLDVVSDDPLSPTVTVNLEGTGVQITPCFLQAQPTGVNFGQQAVGQTVEITVTLTNIGVEQCLLKKVELTTGSPHYGVTASVFPLLGSPVQPGGTSTVLVTFRPYAEGFHAGNVRATFKEFGFGNPDQTLNIPLTGSGLSPAICVSPLNIDFGAVAPGSVRDENVNVANCGPVPLALNGLQMRAGSHPDFHIQSAHTLPAVLAPGANVTVVVRAAPTAAGTAQSGSAMYGTLEVISNDTDDGAIPVLLRANAEQCIAGLVCSPLVVDFGPVDLGLSMVRVLACQNPSQSTVNVNASTAIPFSIVNAPSSIAPGGVGIITVRFEPTTVGPVTGTLDTGANGCNGAFPLNVTLLGDGEDISLPLCPTPTTFSPQVVWHWEGGSTLPGSKQVWTTPMVSRLGDTTGDGKVTRDDMPRVIFPSFDHNDSASIFNPANQDKINDPVPGVIRAVDGATGAEVFTISDINHRVHAAVSLAVADIDGDGFPEIIGQKYVLLEGVADIEGGPKIKGKFVRGNLIAFEHDGSFKWISDEWTRTADDIEDSGGIAVADIDGDGFGEIAIGDHVYDQYGHLKWIGGQGFGSTGHGPVSIFADVHSSPGLELVTGRTVYSKDGVVLWSRSDLDQNILGTTYRFDGHPAVADIDNDGDNEVIVHAGAIYVFDGETGATKAGPRRPPVRMNMGQECQAPSDPESDVDCNIIPTNVAIMDTNDNGFLEIVVAAQEVLIVYDRNLNEVWRSQIWDGTGASGPAGFDFEADGRVNVVYSDEAHVYAYNPTGGHIYDASRGSVTLMETVSIADINNDGHANIAVGSNEPQFGISKGLDMLTNTGTSWAQARGIWNQHAFMERYIGELGTLIYDPGAPLDGFRTTTAACR
jgi:hypothetical protein